MKQDLYVHMTTSGALRGKWEFEYGAKALADAATKQGEDRRARKATWEAEYQKVLVKIKESGISVEESLGRSLSNNTSAYGRGPDVNIDATLRTDLIECHNRIAIHDKAAEEYEAWAAVMKAQGDRRVTLTHADWMYFFGGLDTTE